MKRKVDCKCHNNTVTNLNQLPVEVLEVMEEIGTKFNLPNTKNVKEILKAKSLAEIQVTEHKSDGPNIYANNMVRIFVNRDYFYGYFVDETEVFNSLSPEDQEKYFNQDTFAIPIEKAQHLIDIGVTPHEKVNLL